MTRRETDQAASSEVSDVRQEPDLSETWARTQASLPEGWELDGLRCASTGLAPQERSEEWMAVAVGPSGEEQAFSASDAVAALEGLARSFADR